MPDRKIESEIFFRTLTLDRAQANDETRTVPAALSSELPVSRWFGQEVLAHEESAIDMARIRRRPADAVQPQLGPAYRADSQYSP